MTRAACTGGFFIAALLRMGAFAAGWWLRGSMTIASCTEESTIYYK
ncbi:hypothetical protein [Comamonas odontotermitis]